MIQAVTVRERGSTPRRLRKQMTAHTKRAWYAAGVLFHTELRARRFTPAHAKAAGYAPRKGQDAAPGSKRFRRSYYGRKLRSKRYGGGEGKADPLVYTGRSKRLARMARITSTSKGARVRYPGLRAFNWRSKKQRARPNLEFRRILPGEARLLASEMDRQLDAALATDAAFNTETI